VSHVLLLPPLILSDIEGTDRLTPAEQAEGDRSEPPPASDEANPAALAAAADEAPPEAAPASDAAPAASPPETDPDEGATAAAGERTPEDPAKKRGPAPPSAGVGGETDEGKSSWIFVDDVPDVFIQGNTVGFLYHRGGYVTESGYGGYVRTKNVKVKEHKAYELRASQLFTDELIKHLELRGIAVDEGPALSLDEVPTLTRRDRRISLEQLEADEMMGQDNASLPPFDLVLARKWKALPTEGPISEAEHVLVPIIVLYYAHNVGWFRGQEWGSGGAGGRGRLLWAIYQTSDGRLVAWADVEARHKNEVRLQPNKLEVDDILLKTDVKLVEVLGDSLAR